MKERQTKDRDIDWKYEYWLACIRPLSCKKKLALRSEYKNAKQIYYIEEKELRLSGLLNPKETEALINACREWDMDKKYEELTEKGIRFVPYFHEAYPKRLKDIPSPPYSLYVKGQLPGEDRPAAAVVGARRCTVYGEEMTRDFAGSLARAEVDIISGMALGIDGMAQRAALESGGNTYGVLACGVDVCYPREHFGLYMDIMKRGGLVSEHPPGTPPLRSYFPGRNRIISGLSDIVLVMEAREKSGSLITADFALEQGRDVYALPGPLTSPLSAGCNRLIRQGAGILLTPEELLTDMGFYIHISSEKPDKNKKMLESPENMLYSCVGLSPKSAQQLADETGLASDALMELLIALELKGYIREISKNYYVKI